MTPTISPFGDRAVEIAWPATGYSAEANARALALAAHLRSLDRFTEVTPGYASTLAEFDPTRLDLGDAKALVERELPNAPTSAPQGRTVDIPVRYDGPDLATISKSSGLSEAEVISLHSAEPYRVCMVGFIPGFAFLSEVPAVLAHPRHASPRAHVPAGSVGIAGWQTGIYGLDSPGGWQIIGQTSHALFDPDRTDPFLLHPGDSVRFIPE